MENASKALLIGAGLLIAVLVVSIATRLFSSASSVTKTYSTSMETSEITAFNMKITQYSPAGDQKAIATIYDIISLANYAYDYNSEMVVDPDTANIDTEPGILRIDLSANSSENVITNLQNYQDSFNTLLANCYYTDGKNNNVVKFQMTIKSYNSLGKINHVVFSPENYYQDVDYTISNITN